jgi:SAM-dependent methyltransferase
MNTVRLESFTSVPVAGDTAGEAFWNSTWNNLPQFQKYEGPVFEQHPVLRRFLRGGGEAIEVGCVPGNWLVYLNREYGYRVSGIDYSERIEYTRANLRFNGIEPVDLIHGDLFSFRPEKLYDLVFSSGFVEHFEDHELVVRRHIELTRPGGLIVIMVPNLRNLHWVLCRMFQPSLLAVHRFPLMRREVLRGVLQKNGAEVLHCEYTKTFRPPYGLPASVDFCSRAVQKMLRLAGLDEIPNSIASPYLISVSRKTA